jgi:hypothetical protein
MEAVKDNRSFFLCLFRAMKPNQTTSICLFRAIKANQPTFVCLLRAHKLAQLKVAATPAYSTVRAKLLFFCPQASWLELPLTLCPLLLTLAAPTFQWRNDFVLFSTFQ